MSTIGESLLKPISAVPVCWIAVGVGMSKAAVGVGAGVKDWAGGGTGTPTGGTIYGTVEKAGKTADWWNLGLAIARRWES